MRLLFNILLVLCLSAQAFAQQVTNKVVDAKSAKGVMFVNIGVLHKGIGTVSDEEGNFKLDVSGALPGDTVKFSCIGYADYIITVANLIASKGNIAINAKTTTLKEVTIRPRKTITLGVKTEAGNLTGGFLSNDLGSEIATVLPYTKKKQAQLKRLYISLAQSTYDTLLFRVNVYSFDKGVIGENILHTPILIKSSRKTGVIEVDLAKYDIIFDKPVAVSIEWLKDMGQGSLFFACKFFKGQSYARKTSQADWGKIPVGFGLWADVDYETK